MKWLRLIHRVRTLNLTSVMRNLYSWFLCCIVGALLLMAGCGSSADGPELNKTEKLRLQLSPEIGRYMGQSERAFQQGNFNLAMVYLDSAEMRVPELADVHFMRGRVFTKMNQLPNSQEAYQRAINLDPEYKGAYHNMGVNYFRRGLLRQAIDAFKAEEAIEPTGLLYLELGKCYAKLGEPDSARMAYEQSLTLDGENPTVYMWLGQLLEETGDLEDALEYSLKGSALRPEDPDYEYIIGTLYYRMGQTEKAIEYLRPVAEKQPWHQGAQYNLGQALLRSGEEVEAQRYLALADSAQQMQQAINEAENGINSDPGNPTPWIHLATLLWESGQKDKAVESYRNAVNLEPGNLAMQNNLANMLVESGQIDAGVQLYQRILSVKPDLVEVWVNMGAVLANNKKYEEARFAWEMALEQDPGNASVKAFLKQLDQLEAAS